MPFLPGNMYVPVLVTVGAIAVFAVAILRGFYPALYAGVHGMCFLLQYSEDGEYRWVVDKEYYSCLEER
jgi:hypothetical protein